LFYRVFYVLIKVVNYESHEDSVDWRE